MSEATQHLPSEESAFAVRRDANFNAIQSLATAAIGDVITLQLVESPVAGDPVILNEDLASAAASSLNRSRRVIDRIKTETYENEDGTVTTSSTGAFFRNNQFSNPVYVRLDVTKTKPEAGKPPAPVRMIATRTQAPSRPVSHRKTMT